MVGDHLAIGRWSSVIMVNQKPITILQNMLFNARRRHRLCCSRSCSTRAAPLLSPVKHNADNNGQMRAQS